MGYADYIEGLPLVELEKIRDAGDINFEGITGTVTNETDIIIGALDAGESETFEITGDGTEKVKIEWDYCDDEDDVEILEINPIVLAVETDCPGDPFEYDDVAESTDPSFTLEATAAPVSYRIITMNDETILYDNVWQLNLEYSINFRKKLVSNIVFTPDF